MFLPSGDTSCSTWTMIFLSSKSSWHLHLSWVLRVSHWGVLFISASSCTLCIWPEMVLSARVLQSEMQWELEQKRLGVLILIILNCLTATGCESERISNQRKASYLCYLAKREQIKLFWKVGKLLGSCSTVRKIYLIDVFADTLSLSKMKALF